LVRGERMRGAVSQTVENEEDPARVATVHPDAVAWGPQKAKSISFEKEPLRIVGRARQPARSGLRAFAPVAGGEFSPHGDTGLSPHDTPGAKR
jgi:hypothetical protein